MRKKYMIIGVVIALALILAAVLLTNRNSSDDGLIKIKGYSHKEPGVVTCQSLAPECGTCYGRVIDGACYVTQTEFDQFKNVYPDLEAE